MTGSATVAVAGACSSRFGVLNLTLGLRRDPPLVRTISVVRKRYRGRAGLTVGAREYSVRKAQQTKGARAKARLC